MFERVAHFDHFDFLVSIVDFVLKTVLPFDLLKNYRDFRVLIMVGNQMLKFVNDIIT